MSFLIVQALLQNQAELMPGFTPAQKLVLLTMADHDGKKGCFPSESRLAKLTGLSRPTVSDAVAHSVNHGLIEPRGDTYRGATSYDFTCKVKRPTGDSRAGSSSKAEEEARWARMGVVYQEPGGNDEDAF